MAKITDLTAVDAITGDEFIPIVQGGQTKRSTMTALRALIVPFLQNWYRGDTGPAGPAGPVHTSLAAFTAAPVTNRRQTLQVAGRPYGDFHWRTGDFTARADVIKADAVALTQGAWVPQDADGIQYPGPLGREGVGTALSLSRPGGCANLGQVIHRMQAGLPTSFAVYGDSIPYALDRTAQGVSTGLPFNGSMMPRGRSPWPDALQDSLSINQFGAPVTVVNRSYPGDTARMGFDRWADPTVATPTHVAFIAYGINDGKEGAVPIAQYKADMQAWIEREIAKGRQYGLDTVVVLLTPTPIKDRDVEANVAPYRVVCRQLAAEYGILCIETSELLSGVSDLWCGIDLSSNSEDLVHLSAPAGGELGWQMGSYFHNRDMCAKHIAAGSIWYPHDTIGWGGSILNHEAADGGSFVRLMPGQRYFVSAHFDDDVIPVVHSYNTSATDAVMVLQYGGRSTDTPYRGLGPVTLSHRSAIGPRQSVAGNVLRRGRRSFIVFNDGTVPAHIAKLEFRPLTTAVVAQGMSHPLPALSPCFVPGRILAALPAGRFGAAADYGTLLRAPYRLSALVSLGAGDVQGLAIFADRDNADIVNPSIGNFLFLCRVGADLSLRESVGGAITRVDAVGVFPANADFFGQVELVVTDAVAKVYVNGVERISKNTPTTLLGHPGMMLTRDATGLCYIHAAQAQGLLKLPFAPAPR